MAALIEMRTVFQEWSDFFVAKANVLRRFPALLFQEAANQPDSSTPSRSALERYRQGREKSPWLRHLNKSRVRSACLMTIDHSGRIMSCAFSPDGRRAGHAQGGRRLCRILCVFL